MREPKKVLAFVIFMVFPNHKARWFAGAALNTVNTGFGEKRKIVLLEVDRQ
jgi:hypothetical protein